MVITANSSEAIKECLTVQRMVDPPGGSPGLSAELHFSAVMFSFLLFLSFVKKCMFNKFSRVSVWLCGCV